MYWDCIVALLIFNIIKFNIVTVSNALFVTMEARMKPEEERIRIDEEFLEERYEQHRENSNVLSYDDLNIIF